MVYVLAILAVGLALGAATLAETLSSRSHATLDARQRRALQAADFGVQAVLYHQNELNIDALNLTGGAGVLGKLSSCVVPVLSSGGVTITGTVNATVTTEGVSGSSTVSACPVAQGEGAKGTNGGETFIGIGNHDGYAAEFVPGETVAKAGEPIIGVHQHTNYSGRTDEHLIAHEQALSVSCYPFSCPPEGFTAWMRSAAAMTR